MPQSSEASHEPRRGAFLEITIPKKAAEALDLKEGDIVGFYEDDGNIILREMK